MNLENENACCRKLGLLLLSLIFAARVLALPTDKTLREVRHTAWLAQDGAPTYDSGWTQLAQGADGYILLATSTGLVRFNGLKFEPVEIPLPASIGSQSVSTLYVARSGALWIGFRFGGVGRFEHDKWTFYTATDGIPESTPEAFAQAPDGDLWMLAKNRVWQLHANTWRETTVLAEGNKPIIGLMFDTEGSLWLSTPDTLHYRRSGQLPVTAVEKTTRQWDIGVAESADGGIWIDDVQVIRKVSQVANPTGVSISSHRSLLFDRHGALWGCDELHGLWRVPESRLQGAVTTIEKSSVTDRLTAESGLSSNLCGGPIEDREGNIWAFTAHGLDRLSDAKLGHLYVRTADGSARANLLRPMLVADGPRLWSSILSEPSGDMNVARLEGDRATALDAPLGGYPAAIVQNDGDLLVTTGDGLRKIPELGRPSSLSYPISTASQLAAQSLAEDGAGHLWVSMARAPVFERIGDEWRPYGGQDALPRDTAIFLSTDAKRSLWLTYTGSRVAHVDGAAQNYLIEPSIGNVLTLYGKRSRIWVGGAKGLAVLEGPRFRVLRAMNPRDFMSISGLVETPSGDVWLNGANGFVHVSAEEIRRALTDADFRIKGDVFGAADGVLGIEERLRPLPTMAETADGRLWFATSSEIYFVDPSRTADGNVPPLVHLTGLTVDRTARPLTDKLTLPPRSDELRFDFIGLNVAYPERVRYRYRLDGYDTDWRDGGRQRQAIYGNIGPGTYVFHVTAANDDNQWNDAGAQLKFTILPALYQMIWFKTAIAMAAIGILTLLYLARVRQLSNRFRERHAERLAERDRIARDLHDTLLQSTEGLILKVQGAVQGIPASDPVRVALMKSLDHASELALEGRESIHGLREHRAQRVELAHALQSGLQTRAEGAQPAIDIAVSGSPIELRSEVWEDLYRIGHEALWNAQKHSSAEQITLRVEYSTRELRMTITDDGTGMDIALSDYAAAHGHFGLASMRERAQQLGARLDIWTKSGAGTRVSVQLAGRKAYRKH